METLKQSDDYELLVTSLAEWLTLMELCDDLIHRMVDYKIMQIYDVNVLREKLRANWAVAL